MNRKPLLFWHLQNGTGEANGLALTLHNTTRRWLDQRADAALVAASVGGGTIEGPHARVQGR